MKKVLLMTLALMMVASVALADHIGVYADQAGTDCDLNTLSFPPTNNTLYIVHKFNAGSTASQFKVTDTSGLFATTQTTPYLSIGTWNTDLSLAYGGCVIGDHVLMTLNFLFFGSPAPTCANTLEIGPAPTSPIPGSVALVDCATPSGNLEPVTAGRAYVTGGCIDPANCNPTGTASKTWGGIKALYR
jgi:hypothetical protein